MAKLSAALVAAILGTATISSAQAADALRLVAAVAHHQAEAAAEELEEAEAAYEQNSENVRSQAEKRLEQQRKALTRNWAG